jgi:hypothetical protein
MTSPVVQRLRDAAASIRDERVSMRAMAQAHGPEADGTLLLLLAMPCLLPVPGVGTVLGLGLAALAVAMWRGDGVPRLPQRVAELEVPGHCARRILDGLAAAYTLAGRHARTRMVHVAGPVWRSVTATVVGLMAGVVVMPIPFGNVLPAIAVSLIGLGLVFRDGLAVVLGLLGAGIALFATAGLLFAAYHVGSEWLPGWMAGTMLAAHLG